MRSLAGAELREPRNRAPWGQGTAWAQWKQQKSLAPKGRLSTALPLPPGSSSLQLVYIEFPNGTEKFVKRPFPLGKILAYDQMVDSAYKPVMYE